MFGKAGKIFVAALIGGFGLAAAHDDARAVPFVSGDGSETCVFVSTLLSGTCTIETINDHPAWQSDDALPATWISYGPTGYQDAGPVAPFDLTPTPLIRVIETLVLTETSDLSFAVWADDTAEVFIDGVSVFAPNFTQDTCANGSIGCEPDELGGVSATLSAGTHTVWFDVYQIGTGTNTTSNPFGLLYVGQLIGTTGGGGNSVPEPATLALFGLGLGGLGLAMRRRKSR